MSTRCQGLSLTELMVATTLLATGTAGGLGALSQSQAARREAALLQQLQERAQYAFSSLEPELQMAGYFGAAAPAALAVADIPAPAARCGADLVRRLDLPLQVETSWTPDCPAQGSGYVAGTQVLVTRRVSARLASGAQAGRAQWLSHAASGAGQLFWNGDAAWNPADAGTGAELRDLELRIYYVARSADGSPDLPALRVKTLTSVAGAPAFIDTEVMNGIEDLQVELLPDASAPRSVRVQLRVRAEASAAQRTGVPRTLAVTRHFSLRNARG